MVTVLIARKIIRLAINKNTNYSDSQNDCFPFLNFFSDFKFPVYRTSYLC